MDRGKELKNLSTGETFVDTLHQKVTPASISCGDTGNVCSGSFMGMYGFAQTRVTKPYCKKKALEFMTSYYSSIGKGDMAKERYNEAKTSIERTGVYHLTKEELEYGVKQAWRNAPRCPGRIQWKNLVLRDYRHITDLNEAFEAICQHIDFSTNKGRIQPTITLFSPRVPGKTDPIRIWNPFAIGYAGYQDAVDGTVVGDKGNVAFTRFCQKLGWTGKGQRFDILPIVLSGSDGEPHFYEIPDELVLRVKITHPRYPSFEKLGLEWYALPSVSGMCFEVGGVQFPANTFAGWYSLPEVATRDLLDRQRYDVMEEVAAALEMETRTNMNLHREKISTELNLAVLHSFKVAGAAMVDQFTLCEQFMTFFRQEHLTRGGCPADWVWVNQPQSGSLTEVWHQEMLNYKVTPSYDYQRPLHETYRLPGGDVRRKLSVALKAIVFCGLLMSKALKKRKQLHIYYATETGTAKKFAHWLTDELFSKYMVFLNNIKDLNFRALCRAKNDITVFFVVSTFGNGSCPADAAVFSEAVEEKAMKQEICLSHLRYGVFALGSSVYPSFCQFGKTLDKQLESLGGSRILEVGCGDETNFQEFTFRQWISDVFKSLGGLQEQSSSALLAEPGLLGKAEWETPNKTLSINDNFEILTERKTSMVTLLDKLWESRRYLRLQLAGSEFQETIAPGDNIGIFPRNPERDVERLLAKLKKIPPKELVIKLKDVDSAVSTFNDMLYFYYDITSPMDDDFLKKILLFATDDDDVRAIKSIIDDSESHETWMKKKHKISEVFHIFQSVTLDAANFISLLKPQRIRWYSVASETSEHTGDIVELLLTMVEYFDEEGKQVNGLCSTYVRDAEVGSQLICCHQPRTIFQRWIRGNLPVMMVANGSGIAPFRGIWQARKKLRLTPSQTLLFFGCRDHTENLFDKESSGLLHRHVAYSREVGVDKTYVQDLMLQHADSICKMIFEDGGGVLVCGGVSMAESVKDVLRRIAKDYFDDTEESEATARIARLESELHYIEDIYC